MSSPKATGIAAFCAMHGISRSSFYNLRSKGIGPREMRIGSRVLISDEAASEWRKACESSAWGPGSVGSERSLAGIADEARRRGTVPEHLIKCILEAIVERGLFDFVLADDPSRTEN